MCAWTRGRGATRIEEAEEEDMEDVEAWEDAWERTRNAKEAQECAEAIQEAIRSPDLYHFGEMLGFETVEKLRGTEHGSAWDVLELFAYGTWNDATEKQRERLDEAQKKKLKQLTLLSLVEGQRTLQYNVLLEALEMENVRSLESFLINDCMYAGIAQGLLDQKQGTFEVTSALSRDLRPEDLGALIETVGDWLSSIDRTISKAHERKTWINAESARLKSEKADLKALAQGLKGEESKAGEQMEGIDEDTATGAVCRSGSPSGPTGANRSKRRR